MLEGAQVVVRSVALYTEPASMVQMMFNLPEQIIVLKQVVMDLNVRHILPPHSDYAKMDNSIQTLTQEWNKAWWRHASLESDKELCEELAVMT